MAKTTIPAGFILNANRGKGDESDAPIVDKDTPGFYTAGALFFQHDRGQPWMTHAVLDSDDLEELGIHG